MIEKINAQQIPYRT